MSTGRQRRVEQHFARDGVKCAKPRVVGGGDEHQAAGGRDGTADVRRAGAGDAASRQLRRVAQRHLPADVARHQIHRVQPAPRRLLARQAGRVPESRVLAPRTGASIGQRRARRLLLHEPHGADVVCVDEQQTPSRIGGTARPRRAAHRARIPDRRLAPSRRVETAASRLVEHRLALLPRLWRHRRQLGAGERGDPRQRRRLDGKWLRRPRLLAWDVALRNHALLDAEHRLAGDAVEDEDEPHLGELHDGGNGPPAARDVHQDRLRRQVVVPDVVVDQLPMPAQVAGRRVECDQRVGVEVGPGPIAAVEVVRRGTERQEHQASRLVDAHRRPDVDAGAPLPGILGPRVVAWLSRPRHGVEQPPLLSRPHIKRAHVSGRATRHALRRHGADDDQVAVNRRRRGHAVLLALARVDARAQIEDSACTERPTQPPRRRVNRHESTVTRPREDRGLGAVGALPQRHTAMRRLARARSDPKTDRHATVRRPSRRRAQLPCWWSS